MIIKNQFISILFSSVLLCFVLTGCSSQQSEEEYVDSAKRLLENKAFTQLEITSKNFLAANPKSNLARVFLVKSLVGNGNYNEAVNQWGKIENPQAETIALALADIVEAKYFLGDFEDAQTLITQNISEPVSEKLSFLHFLIKVKTLPLEQIQALNVSDIFVKEDSTYAKLSSSMLDTFLTRDSEALKAFFDQNNDENSAIFQSIAAEHFYNLEEFARSEEYFERYLGLRPKHYIATLSYISTLILQEKTETANIALDDILKRFPNQALANQQKAKVMLMQDNLPAAKVHIERAIQNGFDSRNNHLVAGLINFKLTNYEQAISNLERALSQMQEYSSYTLLLNYAKARVGTNTDSILQPADKIIQELSDIEKIRSLLSGYKDSGNTQLLSSTLKDLSVSKGDTNLAFDLALKQASISTRESEDMFTLAKTIVDNSESYDSLTYNKAKVLHSSKIVNEGNIKQAINLAKNWIDESDYAFMDVLLYSDLLVLDKQYSKAMEVIDKGISVSEHPVYYSRKINIEVALKNYESALSLSEKALKMMPYSLNYLSQYAVLKQVVEGTDNSFIEELYVNHDSNGLALVYLAEFFRETRDNQKAIQLLEQGKDKFEPLSVQIALLLAENYKALGNTAEVNKQLKELSKLELDDLELFPLYTRLFDESMDQDLISDILKQIIRKYPAYVPAQNQLAWQYVKNGKNTEAITLLEALPNADTPEPGRILGLAQRNSGKIKVALDTWDKNYKAFGDPQSLMLMSELSFQLGDKENAVRLINLHLEKEPDHIGLKLLLAGNVESTEAERLYREVLAVDSDNIFALTNLAWSIFQTDKQSEEAKTLIEKARQVSPSNEGVLATYKTIMGT